MTVLLAASVLATLLSVPSPAQASTHGFGFFWNGNGTSWIGSYIPDGTNIQTYCVQGALNDPTNRHDTFDAGYGQYGGSADANARVNYAITNFGQTSDPVMSAATAIYVHSQLDTAYYNTLSGGGLNYYAARANGSANAVKAEFNAIAAASAGITAGAVSGSGTLSFTVDPLNNYNGTMTVSGLPSGATGTVTLTNGIFNVNGTNSVAGVTEGAVFAITGVPPEDGATSWKISGSGLFTVPGTYAGNVNQFVTPTRQLTAGPGQPAASFRVSGEDPVDRSEIFLPVLSTQASAKYVAAGDTFGDVLTFSTGAQADGTNNNWKQDPGTGDYIPVIANGTLYGPFAAPPTPGAAAPPGAPVAGTATATTGNTGPSQPVVVTSSITASVPGYYVWVWTIDSAAQSFVTSQFIPNPYTFSDQFGQVLETSITPSDVSTVATSAVDLGFAASDTATVSGVVTPGITIGFKTYRQAVGADGTVATPTCDRSTLTNTTTRQNVTGPGDYQSPPVTFGEAGTYFWVESLYAPDGTEIASGACGAANEGTVVTQLTVSTSATPTVVAGTPAHDSATLHGTVPAGATITFRAYQSGIDNSGAIIPANTCTADNLVYDSSTDSPGTLTPGVVDGGVVQGPDHTFLAAGTILWIETIDAPPNIVANAAPLRNGRAGTVVVAQGACGDPGETTIVTSPPSPPMARTGQDVAVGPILGGSGGVVALGAVLIMLELRRRRMTASKKQQA